MTFIIRQNWKRVLFALIILMIASMNRPASSAEYKPGQFAIVIKDQSEFKDEDKVVRKAPLGQVIEVGEVNGKWIWVLSTRGWVHQKNVQSVEQVISERTKAIKSKPTSLDYHLRGIAYQLGEKYDQAINDFNSALKSDSKNYSLLINRGKTYALMNKNDLAINDFSSAIKLNGKNAVMFHNRGTVYAEEKKYDLALSDLNKAIELDDKYADAYNSRGMLNSSQGKLDLALSDYNQAIELSPFYISALENRGYIWIAKKEHSKAIDDFSDALKHKKNSKVAINNLAWLLSTCPNDKLRDGKRALILALNGCELTEYKDWVRLDTLAAAYAETGDFVKAGEWIKKTIEMAPESNKESLKKVEKLYQSKKPLRE